MSNNDLKCMLDLGGMLAFAQDRRGHLPNCDNRRTYRPCGVSCRWRLLSCARPPRRQCQGASDLLCDLTVRWLLPVSPVDAFAQEQERLRASLAHVVAEVEPRCVAGAPSQPQLISVPRRFAESH